MDVPGFVHEHAPGFVAVGLNSDQIHAPNERAEMALLLKRAEAAAYLWQELAAEPGLRAAGR
jgi:acetylornithine deacetylase/succinyl-diaminopimelate desuccinylase-like protein